MDGRVRLYLRHVLLCSPISLDLSRSVSTGAPSPLVLRSWCRVNIEGALR